MKGFQKYFFVFLVTCGIFAVGWYLSSYVNNKKINQIKDIQNKIAIDILSSETQFSLLEELSCQDLSNSVLSKEIATIADKISYTEQTTGNRDEVELLKKQYTILQVKDFLLTKRIAERCKQKINTIFYFYGSKDACSECVKQGYVLDALREKYQALRVYSFDYNLDLSTIKALNSIYKIQNTLPSLVVNGKTVSGFKTVEELESLLPKELTSPQKAVTKKVSN
ncbi:MAG TPA: hypothetical protein PLQ20_00870 [Candidatus Paceibacterota bacterium]|jgi:hypothetical protein|nr:hypothetical protein [Candidatus Paceibacterota bacterium]